MAGESEVKTENLDEEQPERLLSAFRRLDHLLEQAALAAQVAYGPEAMADPFRGLHIGPKEVERLLARELGAPVLQPEADEQGEPGFEAWSSVEARLAWVAQAFDLSPFDLDVILIALAPELDLRYERLYAYVQNNVSRRRPSLDLALNLLCPSAQAKLARRAHFASDAPLIRHGLIHLIADPDQLQPPLLAHYLKLDDQIVRLLLGPDSLDTRLVPFCRLVRPTASLDQLPLETRVKQALATWLSRAQEVRRPVRLYFHGPAGSGRRQAAEALAGEAGMSLLAADLARAATAGKDWAQALRLLFREAWFQGAVLYLEGLDGLRSAERAVPYQQLLETLAADTGIAIMAGTQPWAPPGNLTLGVVSVQFAVPTPGQRLACWQIHLAAEGIALETDALTALADRFQLTPGQIADAAATACNHALGRIAGESPDPEAIQPISRLTLDDLFAAARAQSGHDLAALAHKVEPKYTWGDIVLPDDTVTQLREMCQRVAHRRQVLGQWGFDHKLSLGKGVTALFAGPSGTGKTMAAEIIADELGLDLYKIDLSGVVSKYIGETEKNLDRIFNAAENANAILFFDEADALFGKRSEVRDSHDRYANIEISYLLQKMEQYQGIAILATNLRQNLDEAFVRRLAFTVHFPFPGEDDRLRIWQGIWPAATPVGKDVNLEFLARQFKLSGGNIKNIALSAAFLASADGGQVTMAHLFHATQREYQKLGKVLSVAELYGSLMDARAGSLTGNE